jgi:tRNA pseudouridine38-40 synthase
MERRARSQFNRRVALEIQYDGEKFHGWQLQNHDHSVQGEIENALKVLTGQHKRITAAGRTDAGVHALGQIAHFDLERGLSLEKLCISLNGIMSNDVSIKNAYFVPDDFHARYSACEREYLYKIYNHTCRSPFIHNSALWIRHNLDVDYLREAVSYLEGNHDFASFCKKISLEENTIRTVNKIEIEQEHEYIYFKIRGTAFLHNMIRIIIGTLVEMSKQNLKPEHMKEVLEAKDRDKSGMTAAACGLYFKKITYSPDLSSYEAAF